MSTRHDEASTASRIVVLSLGDLHDILRTNRNEIIEAVQQLLATDDRPEYLSSHEAAELLRVTTRTLHTLRANGTLPYIKSGRRILYPRAGLDNYLRERSIPATASNH